MLSQSRGQRNPPDGSFFEGVGTAGLQFAIVGPGVAVSDGFPRVLGRMRSLVARRPDAETSSYWIALVVLMAGALLFIVFLRGRFTQLIDLATTLSFLAAPIIGYLNIRAVTSEIVPGPMRPPRWWLALAWSGLVFLTALGLVYLFWRFLA